MSNHIADASKMVDTPRTDAKRSGENHFMGDWVDANFARQLERELNAANAEIEEKRKDVVWLATEKAKLEERVKQLETENDAMRADLLLWNDQEAKP